jgi:hypothetical protein
MKSFIRNALLGAAGLVALTLPAAAASPTTTIDTPAVVKSDAKSILLAQASRPYDPSAGSVGFKKKAAKKKGKKKKKKAKKAD